MWGLSCRSLCLNTLWMAFILISSVVCSESERIQADICLSLFKCEEFKENLRSRMRLQYYRFGNFEPSDRHCILEQIEKVCSVAATEDCISLGHLDYAVIHSLGECIPEMKIIRDHASRLASHSRRSLKNPNASSARVAKVRQKPKPILTHSLPYGSPLRRIARFIGTEPVTNRFFDWSHGCDSGEHWCCVFIGDDQDFSCFKSWCPGKKARCT